MIESSLPGLESRCRSAAVARRVVFAAVVAFIFARSGASGARAQDPVPRVFITVSVDWEGMHLEERNLAAMEALRRDYPRVPFTHFLNAAYYTKKGAVPATITAQIRRTLKDGDETGLHIHPWRTLVEAAGVPFRAEPTFWEKGAKATEFPDGDAGHDVELPAYTVDEIRKIVRESKRVLAQNGFEPGTSFRAGGWLADAKVLEAIRAEGYVVDSSAVDATWHEKLAGLPIRDRIRETWPKSTPTSAPETIETKSGTVLEMPNTAALADYVTARQMIENVERAIELAKADPLRPRFVHVGFHQETAAEFSPRVVAALFSILKNPEVRFVTLAKAAEEAAKM